MKLKTIRDIAVKNKRVLVRADFNVPLVNGKVSDDTRIRQALPTIKFLLEQNAKIILLSHLGRPHGRVVAELRLDPVAERLTKLLKIKVQKLDDCVGPEVQKKVSELKNGEILLLENTRFHSQETENEKNFANELASYGDIFIQDAFGVVHRAHASTVGVALRLPSAVGLLVEKEIAALTQLFEQPKKPLVLVIGGAKIDTKIGVLRKFIEKADTILLGGGLANTFLAAEGFEVGASLHESSKIELARELLLEAKAANCELVLPEDAVCADVDAELNATTPALDLRVDALPFNLKILDIGARTQSRYSEIIKRAGTVVWNGPVGLFECFPFAGGTKAIAEACASAEATTLLGGGDTLEALMCLDIPIQKFTHISTGGGAMLKFLEGKELPALAAVEKHTA